MKIYRKDALEKSLRLGISFLQNLKEQKLDIEKIKRFVQNSNLIEELLYDFESKNSTGFSKSELKKVALLGIYMYEKLEQLEVSKDKIIEFLTDFNIIDFVTFKTHTMEKHKIKRKKIVSIFKTKNLPWNSESIDTDLESYRLTNKQVEIINILLDRKEIDIDELKTLVPFKSNKGIGGCLSGIIKRSNFYNLPPIMGAKIENGKRKYFIHNSAKQILRNNRQKWQFS